jgi:hypothetical protein
MSFEAVSWSGHQRLALSVMLWWSEHGGPVFVVVVVVVKVPGARGTCFASEVVSGLCGLAVVFWGVWLLLLSLMGLLLFGKRLEAESSWVVGGVLRPVRRVRGIGSGVFGVSGTSSWLAGGGGSGSRDCSRGRRLGVDITSAQMKAAQLFRALEQT